MMTNHAAIYLDHAASTPTDPQVLQAMLPYFSEIYGNASGLHQQARASGRAISEARHKVADILGCTPQEIIFTACGSESDNLAIRGVAWAKKQAGAGHHIITSPVEHSAVSKTINQLCDQFGFEQTIVPVNEYGQVSVSDIAAAIRPDTILISVMYANNEVGSLQPIPEIGTLARARNILFHTDAVQAAAYQPLPVEDLKVDLLAISGHKIYAPKGVGLLYVRRGTPLLPVLTGGDHEHGQRPGTENVPYIVALATALELGQNGRNAENQRQTTLRDRLVSQVLTRIPHSQLTGHPTERLPGSASFVFEGGDATNTLLHLDRAGIQAASGSACHSGLPKPSQVLTAMGIPHALALSALRLTLGKQTGPADIDQVVALLPDIIAQVRQTNPAYQLTD
jgi:cysteine desulfurase